MESKISSSFFSTYYNSTSTPHYTMRAVLFPYLMYLYEGDSGGTTVTVSANSSKSILWDADPPSLDDGELRSVPSIDLSYKNASEISFNQYSASSQDSVGPILGFYSGSKYLAYSGICRYTPGKWGGNSAINLSNPSSSSTSVNIDTSGLHVNHYLISAIRVQNSINEEPVILNDYIINTTTE